MDKRAGYDTYVQRLGILMRATAVRPARAVYINMKATAAVRHPALSGNDSQR